MPLISVIVAIYQSEQFIRRCLNSILSQTLEDIEVLLVNDGSTDRSGEICDEYAQNDARIRVFHKPHSGVSDARQMGLENATGTYVIHCDSDDWMEPTMMENLFVKAEETDADMVVCDFYYHIKNKSVYVHQNGEGEHWENLSFFLWNKLIKRTLFSEYNINFSPNVFMAEDMYIILNLLNHSLKLEWVSNALYHYDHNTSHNSILENVDLNILESNIKMINDLSDELKGDVYRKLVDSKIFVLQTAYKKSLLSPSEIYRLFPECHSLIVKKSVKHFSLIPITLIICAFSLLKMMRVMNSRVFNLCRWRKYIKA